MLESAAGRGKSAPTGSEDFRMTDRTELLDGLARLARLSLAPAERAALSNDLDQMLGLIDELTAVDVANVEPLAHPHDMALRLRADAVTEPDRSEEFLAAAPDSHAGYFLVPRVIE